MHDHDALTWQYPEHLEDKIIPILHKQHSKIIQLKHGRELNIPYDCKVGWNKGDWNAKTNPDGLKDYIGEEQRKRQPTIGLLDRIVRRHNKQS